MQSTRVLDQHRKVLGILFVVFGALWALGAIGVLAMFMFGAESPANEPRDRTVALWIGGGVSAFLLLLAAVKLVAGFGMLKRRAWSKVPAVIAGLLSLFNIPVGTALGIYTLWFWLQPNSWQLFFPQEREPRGPELRGPDMRRPLPT